MTTNPPSLSYEQARDELAAVVGKLEAGTASLDDSLKLWERGEQLVQICEYWLTDARERIAAVRDGASSGSASATDS